MFAQGMFQIDPNATPDQVERKRAMIAALMPRFGQAKYVGEGLGQLATGIAMGAQNRKLDRAENAGRQGASDLFSRIMGGARGDTSGFSILGQGQQAAPRPTDPNDPVNIAGDTMTALGKDAGTSGYRASLIGTESGGNWKAQNSEMGAGGKKGHFGRVQFGQARLQEAMNAGAIPQGTTPEQFMNSPALQIAAENWHFSDLERQLSPLVGTVVNGKPLDLGALVAMGHLGGAAGARRFVETGGRYNPSDTFGTSLADYAAKHGGLSSELSSAARPVQASIDEAAIYEALANPWLNAQQRAALTDMLSQSRQNADPIRQLEMQKLQKEVELMGQPQTPEVVAERRALAAEAGLQPGTPEYQAFMVNGEIPGAGGKDDPTSVREYQFYAQQAIARGEQPIPYEKFITLEAAAGNPATGNFTQPVTPGQEQIDKAYAPEYVQWTQGGGADMANQIATIEGIADRLGSGTENLTGPGVGSQPDWLGAWTTPNAVSAREDVESVVQRNLRVLLGAQFTQAEGDRLIARAYNPRLPEKENAIRLRRLAKGMRAAAEARADQAAYYEANGTLVGWQGKVWTPSDFENLIEDGPPDSPEPDKDGWQTINGVKVRIKQ